jgi:hypothetical protein
MHTSKAIYLAVSQQTLRPEDSSVNSSALKQRDPKPETKTDIQKFADFELESNLFKRKTLKP